MQGKTKLITDAELALKLYRFRKVPGIEYEVLISQGGEVICRSERNPGLWRVAAISQNTRTRPYKRYRVGRMYRQLGHDLLLAWVGPKPFKHQARFQNGDCTDVRLSNLAWGLAPGRPCKRCANAVLPVQMR